MKVTKYEIDMLDVKSADAFLIHFYDKNEYIVLIDGGNYSDGETIAKFIRNNYTQKYIDLAICTHCDKDHFGGIQYLLEQQRDGGKDNMNIKKIWVNDPGKHVSLGKVKWKNSLMVEARSVYDYQGENMMTILDGLVKNNKIEWYEPFSDIQSTSTECVNSAWNGLIEVLGPTKNYYETLVPDFRNDLKKINYDKSEDEGSDEPEYSNNKVKCPYLDSITDDPSSHNQSSVIIRFNPDNGEHYLFMGDAGKDAIDNMEENLRSSLSNTTWLKVPHHGSPHNMDSDLINLIRPNTAYISTEKYGHYLSKSVVNSLKKVGTRVYSTNNNGSMCHHRNTETHKGYSPATPL